MIKVIVGIAFLLFFILLYMKFVVAFIGTYAKVCEMKSFVCFYEKEYKND